MAEPDSIILVYLRRLDEKTDRLIDDGSDLTARMTGVDQCLAGVQRRIDRMEWPLGRVATRLDMVDSHS